MVYLICGLPGSGKTTVSKLLEYKLRCRRITTEDVRFSLYGPEKNDRDFTKEELQKVYDRVYSLVRSLMKNGHYDLIVDGVFRNSQQRDMISDIVKEFKQQLKVIEIVCSDPVARERLLKRKKDGTKSPAGWDARLEVAREFEPIKGSYLVIDSEQDLEEQFKLSKLI